jgi:hypothetical protein
MLFERKIVPMLRERGLSGDEVDRLTYVNPMQFFLGDVGAWGRLDPVSSPSRALLRAG